MYVLPPVQRSSDVAIASCPSERPSHRHKDSWSLMKRVRLSGSRSSPKAIRGAGSLDNERGQETRLTVRLGRDATGRWGGRGGVEERVLLMAV